jgi:hypothetical protein
LFCYRLVLYWNAQVFWIKKRVRIEEEKKEKKSWRKETASRERGVKFSTERKGESQQATAEVSGYRRL